ncbi:hypothetical protein B5C26_23605 [Photorhabdus luminescens]|uniref:hypothetical protein n=1 Tax=Photorhabdus luminescens TaxID=29488 RepID=UPI000B4D44D3|nr:hypothetical protein [Photorhabdus luminescens]OWO78681.1 hypothetical protein B5C26_23605 [Photorhabdus luminescens]
MSKVKYAVYDFDDSDSRFELKSAPDVDSRFLASELKNLAEECAEDYFDNHDGWDDIWPLDIYIWIDNESVGKFTVNIEMEPAFSAKKVDDDQ